jgi:acetolactate synthase-1/2/3 large subunit
MQYKIPVKIVLLNNSFLGMVRQWQDLFFDKRYAATEMENPDFVEIAKGYGIPGKRVAARSDLEAALDEMLSSPSAYLLEVTIEKEGNIFPMIAPGKAVSEVMLESENK